jgi:bacterioferritin
MMHFEKGAERILFLKGEVEMKASHDLKKIYDVKKMLEMAAGMEAGSVRENKRPLLPGC